VLAGPIGDNLRFPNQSLLLIGGAMNQPVSNLRLNDYPMRKLNLPTPSVELQNGADGIVYMSCGIKFEGALPSLIDYLQRAVHLRPEGTFLAQRDGSGQWSRLTYSNAWRDTGAVATWLIRKGLGPHSQPLMILSENSIEHAVLMLGALRAGVAVVPVSPTFSSGGDFSRLGYALELIEPCLVFAQDAARYADALRFAAGPNRHTLTGDQFAQLLGEVDDAAVSARHAQIAKDTIAKILLTSGSTGRPKGAVNTHGNIAASLHMIQLVSEPLDLERTHTIVDWLPWHHTFGGNAQMNGVIARAGTLYIDDGRPLPGQFKVTIENLREISPTGFGCVPGVYNMLAEALERDTDLRHKFFKNLRWLSYGGGLLPQPLWERVQRLAVQEVGERLPFGTGWGMTETTATGVGVYWSTERTGLVGLPQPGVTIKLLPTGDRLELRIKGPQIMPNYYRAPDLNAAAFDEEGYFKTGDAVRWVNRQKPIEGLEFAGRLAEDFKLLSGTWVQGSLLRRDLVAALQPLVADAVICGPDKPNLCAMVWLSSANTDDVRTALANKLADFNSTRRGGASVVERLLILIEPPQADAGEITDKRSINQRCVLERRVADVAALFADPIDIRVIVPRKSGSL
jgi:feruloyl-CoA synthase